MITNAGLVIRPLVGLGFLIAGAMLLRRPGTRAGAWLITLGALLFLGSELYGIFMLRPFVGRFYDDDWHAQIAAIELASTVGLLLCAVGLIGHARRGEMR
jgi:hypothetical protein